MGLLPPSREELLAAQSIINAYGTVVESSAQEYGVVSPESLLPHSREQIKGALKTLARAHPTEPDVLAFFATGYVLLGSFVSDDEARAWKEFKNHVSPENDVTRAEVMRQALERMECQSRTLSLEWKGFLSELVAGEPK